MSIKVFQSIMNANVSPAIFVDEIRIQFFFYDPENDMEKHNLFMTAVVRF